MAREINRLSARAVATDKKPGLKADGGGLYLQVSPALTKSWIFRFTWEGNLRDRRHFPVVAFLHGAVRPVVE